MKKQAFIILVFILINIVNVYGQNTPDTTHYRIDTKDGNLYTGTIVGEDSVVLILRTENLGDLQILRKEILSVKEIKQYVKVDGKLWLPNPQSTRYFWAPNGYGLKNGEAYYQNIWVFYNQASFGLSDNFSFGAGIMPLFLIAGSPTPVWIVPKLSIPVVKDKFNLGAGTFLGTVIGADSGVFGLFYGTSTYGTRDKNLSLGLAYGFVDDDWLKIPIINVSGMFRTGPRGYFISENYVISSDGETVAIFSAGGRSIIRNIGIDYSLWIITGSGLDEFVALPFLGLTIPIRTK